MLLTAAQVRQFKSIEDSGPVDIDDHVTVLVGQNESGKTAFLQALHKSRPVDKVEYNLVEDFPRRRLNAYVKEHEKNPAIVTELTYTLEPSEIQLVNDVVGFELLDRFSFTRTHRYDGTSTVDLQIPEQPYVQHLVESANLPEDLSVRASQVDNLRQLVTLLEGSELGNEGKGLLRAVKETFAKVPEAWPSMLNYLLWTKVIGPRVPRFLYFDDYYLLPGKVNLPQLQRSLQSPANMPDEDKTTLSLLRMAGIDLNNLMQGSGYESVKAKLEAISNTITDKVFQYWRQNTELEVEFDLREDPHDTPPFNQGVNLYIRIRDRRHRVTVPFSQRSKGFVWFFSFIVWFDSIKSHLGTTADLLLLLDEPGLNLHALAQADFLRYISDLSGEHQILYSTHSPFMVPTNSLFQVRTVELRPSEGSRIANNVVEAERRTLYPLQAALGFDLAQNLFSGARNLLVEGPADLIYLKYFSGILDKQRRTTLRDDVTVVPMGGMSKLSAFMALLGANETELAVLEGSGAASERKGTNGTNGAGQADALVGKRVLSYGHFRDGHVRGGKGSKDGNGTGDGESHAPTSIEDLLSPGLYLKLFNGAYKEELGNRTIEEDDLPPGDSIRSRVEAFLRDKNIKLRDGGGYDPYQVASYLVSNPIPGSKIDAATLARFEHLFRAVNDLYSAAR